VAHPNYPPSLDLQVVARSFIAGNGELGVLPQDVATFVEACRRDGFAVLGWEMWLADYRFWRGGQVRATGSWDGLIPCKGDDSLSLVGGDVHGVPGEPWAPWAPYVDRSVEETLDQIGRFSISEVEDEYVSDVRYNFTLSRREH
jgi:hypothetical protein